jgi:hypothetical protein
MRKARVLIVFLILFSLLSGVSQDSEKTYRVKVEGFTPSQTPLSCMNKITFELRITNILKRCVATEISLGATEIKHPANYPNKIDSQVFLSLYCS